MLNRYSYLTEEDQAEEIILLKGRGCFWKQCRFCNYYLDSGPTEEIIKEDLEILESVTGKAKNLTVLNSGSYFELPKIIREKIKAIILEKEIKDLTIESHPHYLKNLKKLREEYAEHGVRLHARIGIETFDDYLREGLFNKGFGEIDLETIKKEFDQCCLLFGVKGQNLKTLKKDLELAVSNFDRVYLNLYEEREGLLPGDPNLEREFLERLYPKIKDIPNLYILLNNTDLGVG